MLPFSKRKNHSEEVELGEEDFELVELAATAAPVQVNPRNADLARTVSRASRPRTIIPVSRRILDEDVEEDVAGQCLASIAAETSRDGSDPYSSSHIRAALQRPLGLAAPVEPVAPAAVAATSTAPSASASATSRLPAVSAPPFLRTTTIPFRGYNDAPGVRDSSPPPAFVRRSSPVIPVIPAAAPSSYVAVAAAAAASGAEGNAASVAPVALPMTQRPNEPTVIVIRERPRAAWIFAAAAIGALGSFGATRLVSAPPESVPPAAAATQLAAPLVAPPSTVVVAPPAPLAPAAPAVLAAAPVVSASPVSGQGAPAATTSAAPGAAIVHFGDDQGVAIKSPAPRRPAASAAAPSAPPAAPATARSTGPRAPSMGPALPDGSFGLVRSDTATTSSVAPPAPPLTASAFSPAAEPPRKHALTPEQQLAAAQLKASMK